MLVVDNTYDGKEDHEQGGERQGLFKCGAELMLIDETVEGCQKDDDRKADNANCGQMQAKSNDQPEAYKSLNNKLDSSACAAFSSISMAVSSRWERMLPGISTP